MSQADGSPTAAAIDGAQLALRMIEAAESAAAAAKAAATRPDGRDDWHKMLPKPGNFDPKDRDAGLSQFRDWWWSVEQYLIAVDVEYSAHFDVVRQNLNNEIDAAALTPEQRRRGTFLYAWLVYSRTGHYSFWRACSVEMDLKQFGSYSRHVSQAVVTEH